MANRMIHMSQGSPLGHLLRHALPLLLGNLLQLSYNAIDSIIAGRILGQEALAAEGIAGPVMNLVILAITGLCIGAGVLMSEAFGAKKYEDLQKVLANTLLAGFGICCLLVIGGIVFSQAILEALRVPPEILGMTTVYLRITFLGAPFTFCYNALAAALKSVGDAKTPLRFLGFSAILNGVLDLIFLGIFRFGILCSALTTVFAEGVCAGLSLSYMLRNVPELAPKKGGWKLEPAILRQILRYGGPTALQQAIQPVCKVLIQGQVNALGVSTIAAFNAVTRMDDFACIPAQSISSAISTFIAQNRGAQRTDRIRPGFRAGIRLELCWWLIIGTVTLLFRGPIVSLFVDGEGSGEVISLGSRYLLTMAVFYLLPAMTNGVQGFFRGMGKMGTTMVGTFTQASIRTLCVYLLAPRVGILGIALGCAIGWSAMLLFEVPYYFVICRKKDLPRRERMNDYDN